MALTPFHHIPKEVFFRRMIGPSLGVFVFFFFCMGILANAPEFQLSSGPTVVPPFWVASFRLYRDVFSNIFQAPGVCWTGGVVNDFQVQQCDEYFGRLFKIGGLALGPFVFLGIFLYIGMDLLVSVHKKGQRRASQGKVVFGGMVTNPPEAPGDIFSWFYCLRPIMVQLTDKTQLIVYIPLEVPIPLPGETLAVFEKFHSFGVKRHLAVLYAPHVAVVSGS